MVYIGDQAFLNQRKHEQRRKVRLLQVRKMSKEAAEKVRDRVRTEQVRAVQKVGQQELQKYIAAKSEELARLEDEYQNALAAVGLGHEGLQELEEYETWKREQTRLQDEVASVRGEHALKVVQYKNMIETKLKENRKAVKGSVILTEKLRAAKVRSKQTAKRLNTVQIIEFDAKSASKNVKKVRFVDRKEVVQSNVQGHVRRLALAHEIGNGLEAAIREQEENARSEQKSFKEARETEMARRRGEAALQKAKLDRITIPNRAERLSPVAEVSTSLEVSKSNDTPLRYQENDFDRFLNEDDRCSERRTLLSRRQGNLSGESEAEISQSEVDSRFQALLNRRQQRQQEVSNSQGVEGNFEKVYEEENYNSDDDLRRRLVELSEVDLTPVRGPSASSDWSSSSSLHGTVSRKQPGGVTDPTYPALRGSKSDKMGFVEEKIIGSGTGPTKNSETDRNFIAKILQGVDLNRDRVNVKIDLQECSTFSSSNNLSSYSSNVSIDVRSEKFLAESWGADPIHDLIDNLRKGPTHNTDTRDLDRQRQLRCYIEKLLRMKRQEIADLSVTTTSTSEESSTLSEEITSTSSTTNDSSQISLTHSNSSLTSTTSTLSSSFCSLKSSKKSSSRQSSFSNTEQGGSQGFASSTPSSILSGSENSKSSLPKTVRFQLAAATVSRDQMDGTFMSAAEQQMEAKKFEILEQTKISLEEVGRQYLEQRRYIEEQLERRRQLKLKDSSKEIHSTEVSDTHITTPDSPSSFQKDSDLGYEFQQRSLQSGLAETHVSRHFNFKPRDRTTRQLSSQSDSSLSTCKKDKENIQPQLSEGPLSSSSSSNLSLSTNSLSVSAGSVHHPVLSSLSTSGLDNLSSNSSSGLDILKVQDVERIRTERESKIEVQKQIRKQQLKAFEQPGEKQKLAFLLANKSSSSGTSTSTATAEFLSRLREMEMPTLRRPTPEQLQRLSVQQQQSSGQNTSADLAKIQDLESSKAS